MNRTAALGYDASSFTAELPDPGKPARNSRPAPIFVRFLLTSPFPGAYSVGVANTGYTWSRDAGRRRQSGDGALALVFDHERSGVSGFSLRAAFDSRPAAGSKDCGPAPRCPDGGRARVPRGG